MYLPFLTALPLFRPISSNSAEPLTCAVSLFAAPWSKTQELNILGQLNSGIRYLDLRIWKDPSTSVFLIEHGLLAESISEILDQIHRFLHRNKKEFLVLDFQSLKNCTKEDHVRLSALLLSEFGESLFVDPNSVQNCTLDELWATEKRIVVLYDHAETAYAHPTYLCPRHTLIRSDYANSDSVSILLGFLQSEVECRRPTNPQFWVLQGVLTPQTKTVVCGILTFGLATGSILRLAKDCNDKIVSMLQTKWGSAGANIIILDYADMSELTPVCFEINKKRGFACRTPSPSVSPQVTAGDGLDIIVEANEDDVKRGESQLLVSVHA